MAHVVVYLAADHRYNLVEVTRDPVLHTTSKAFEAGVRVHGIIVSAHISFWSYMNLGLTEGDQNGTRW